MLLSSGLAGNTYISVCEIQQRKRQNFIKMPQKSISGNLRGFNYANPIRSHFRFLPSLRAHGQKLDGRSHLLEVGRAKTLDIRAVR